MSFNNLKSLFDDRLPQAILFDLDGTLIDSVPDLALAIDLALEDLNLPRAGEENVRLWVGNGAAKLAERAFGFARSCFEGNSAGLTDQKLLERFLYHYGHIPANQKRSKLYDGVVDVLKTLAEHNIRMAIVTNKPEQFTPSLLKAHDIFSYFEVIVCGDSTAEKKPSSMPLEYALEGLGVCVESALMVGDSKSDILAAKACGMKSASVAWGYNHGEDVANYNADLRMQTLAELLR